MVAIFDEDNGVWRDENGRYTSKPDDAEGLTYDPSTDQFRFSKGEPNAGRFAPDPRREPIGWSYKDDAGNWRNPKTGGIISRSQALNRNRNLERATIFKNWVNKERGLTYSELQSRFRGVPTEDIRGKFEGFNEETGRTEYSPPTEEVREILQGITDDFGISFGQDPSDFLVSP